MLYWWQLCYFSAGVGRTGTFIALGTLLQHIADHDWVDVFGLACEMRQHRNHMIQTEVDHNTFNMHACIIQVFICCNVNKWIDKWFHFVVLFTLCYTFFHIGSIYIHTQSNDWSMRVLVNIQQWKEDAWIQSDLCQRWVQN